MTNKLRARLAVRWATVITPTIWGIFWFIRAYDCRNLTNNNWINFMCLGTVGMGVALINLAIHMSRKER